MANGNTIAEIRSILADKGKVSQGVVNRLTLSIMAEMYQRQEEAAEASRKNHEETKVRLDALEKYSIGLWMYRKPKTAFATVFLIVSFLISDIRQPVFAWLGGILQTLLQFKLI